MKDLAFFLEIDEKNAQGSRNMALYSGACGKGGLTYWLFNHNTDSRVTVLKPLYMVKQYKHTFI